jgi:ribosome-associated translation inhibitor RaiA
VKKRRDFSSLTKGFSMMQVAVHSDRRIISENQLEVLHKRLEFALARFEARLGRVAVYLHDLNGDKGGVDKQCKVIIPLRRGKSIVMEDRDSNWLALFDRIAERIGYNVSKEFERLRSRQHGQHEREELEA